MAAVRGPAASREAAQPWCVGAARGCRQRRARDACTGRLSAALARVAELEGLLTEERRLWLHAPDGGLDREVEHRLALVQPVLREQLTDVGGRRAASLPGICRARRNAAVHVFDVPAAKLAAMSAGELNAAQRGRHGPHGPCGHAAVEKPRVGFFDVASQSPAHEQVSAPTVMDQQKAAAVPQEEFTDHRGEVLAQGPQQVPLEMAVQLPAEVPQAEVINSVVEVPVEQVLGHGAEDERGAPLPEGGSAVGCVEACAAHGSDGAAAGCGEELTKVVRGKRSRLRAAKASSARAAGEPQMAKSVLAPSQHHPLEAVHAVDEAHTMEVQAVTEVDPGSKGQPAGAASSLPTIGGSDADETCERAATAAHNVCCPGCTHRPLGSTGVVASARHSGDAEPEGDELPSVPVRGKKGMMKGSQHEEMLAAGDRAGGLTVVLRAARQLSARAPSGTVTDRALGKALEGSPPLGHPSVLERYLEAVCDADLLQAKFLPGGCFLVRLTELGVRLDLDSDARAAAG